MAQVEDMLHKMMRRFDASDGHNKELRNDLLGIGKKFDTHAISIKQLELQMTQLSATVNTWKPGTLTRNTVQNPKIMDTVWQLLLGEVNKPLTHLCRLMRKR